MSTVPVRAETLHAFDRHAAGYAAGWGADPLARMLRARVLAIGARFFPPGGRLLDLGCGAGLDASVLRSLGHSVLAIDASAGMLAEARGRADAVRRLDLDALDPLVPEGPFDGALSNFGALNCLPRLEGFAAALPRLLRPGACAVLVVIDRHCVAETLALAARGRRPRRHGATVAMEGVDVPVRYLDARSVLAALGPAFRLEHREALGALMPPPDLGGRPGWRSRLEPFVAAWPIVRDLGDHALLVVRRLPVGAEARG
jgi:SAM-dependent methyltransferase